MAGRKPTTTDVRFDEKCEPRESGCIEWTGGTTGRDGYGLFYAAGQMRPAHRWAYERKHGALIPGFDVCHRCDNKLCVRLDHLFVGTRLDNMRDAVRKGRTSHVARNVGEQHPLAKLTATDVVEIRRLHKAGATQTSIARLYSMSVNNANRIVRNLTWRSIP